MAAVPPATAPAGLPRLHTLRAPPWRRRPGRRLRSWLAAAVAAVTLLTACSTPDPPATPSNPLSSLVSSALESSAEANGSTTGTASATPTTLSPVTQTGMRTGPGVTASTITLGVLADPADRSGFAAGLRLWRDAVNAAGGLCQRTVALAAAGDDGAAADPVLAYQTLGTRVLGFVTDVPDDTARAELAVLLSADQVPAITLTGPAADLAHPSPVLVGATADILAIDAAFALVDSGGLDAGTRIGVAVDGSAVAANAAAGLRWFAGNAELTVVPVSSGDDLSGLAAVFAFGAPTLTAALAKRVDSAAPVVSLLDGYDPALLDAAAAAHVRVVLPTAVPGSVAAPVADVEAALTATGQVAGPRTFAGYALGQTWGRLIGAACTAQTLTRAGVQAAMLTVGPAGDDSLIGPSDPQLPVADRLPATRTAALAQAAPGEASGLRPLTELVAADEIDGYTPAS